MAKLSLAIKIYQSYGSSSYEFSHKVLYLKAGNFAGSTLSFDAPSNGSYVKDYENQLAAWKQLSLAIQGNRALAFSMPADPESEKFYQKHTSLAEKISHTTIMAFSEFNPEPPPGVYRRPDQSIDIFDATVSTRVMTVGNVSLVGMYYSGATKEWF